jgi:phosphoribosyl 1,2-cyclic phosphodiesterase
MSHPEYHMGLDTCKKFCKANISASTKQIVLIHLSHANVNEQHAIDTIKEYCNFDNVAVAHKGDTFKIESDDF